MATIPKYAQRKVAPRGNLVVDARFHKECGIIKARGLFGIFSPLREYRTAARVHRIVNASHHAIHHKDISRRHDEPHRSSQETTAKSEIVLREKSMTELNRRTVLSGAALAGAAIALGPIALKNTSARASAPAAGKQVPGFYRYKVGDYEITALNDGVFNFELKDGFVKNAALPGVRKALTDAFQPTNVVRI
ncbi:MAG TPA: hypothetical protein VN919_03975, partial [Xanthobacteraceae bacterium]|nr:hypothetical protein [Xanthobacteraceae bacterium]